MTAAALPEAAVFGDRLRELREKRELTLRSLADLAGMSYTFISDMERGLRVPTLTTIIRLAVALDCKLTDLVGMFDKKNLRSLVKKHSGRDR
jgi:transcriptional regulator with XRE-family HTH domain